MEVHKKIIIQQIKSNIVRRLGVEVCTVADEELDALAYACTFRAPRPFKDITMSPESWNELADTISIIELMNVHGGLKNFKSGGNRLFYILGCFARVYGRRYVLPQSHSNFKERPYTRAELAKTVTPISMLSEDDL